MRDTLTGYLIEDHEQLHALLEEAAADPAGIRLDAFERFRSGLLRHIGIEEKILLPAARQRRGGEPLPGAHRLRIEHGALASLMVPTPDAALLAELQSLLAVHNGREEGADGIYAACEQLFGDESALLAAKARAYPAVPLMPHFDGVGVHRTAQAALAAAERARHPAPGM